MLGAIARVWVRTLRVRFELDDALDDATPWALAVFHGQQFPLFSWGSQKRAAVLVSRSKDGEKLARALPGFGFDVARGSSSRGGAEGLRSIVRFMRRGVDGVFAVDGPKGPREIVRSHHGRAGVALAAELGGGVVVPMASACRRSLHLRSWDAFELPLPGTRVVVALGAPIAPRDASPERIAEAIDAARRRAQDVLSG